MGTSEQLRVRVNDELSSTRGPVRKWPDLTARRGWFAPRRPRCSTRCSAIYLRAKPAPQARPSDSAVAREGAAAAAVVLRWGSYLAVLRDRDKPIWPAVHSEGISRLSDREMARINIEASAALAAWVDL